MTTPIRPPKDDLFRAMSGGMTTEDGKTLTIRLAPHDSWAEIDSVTEGHFMERFKRNAYAKTLRESTPKILFQHGKDPQIGEKPIASTDEVGEDEISPYARGQILDGVPELVVDGLRKGVYGSSHRFSVVREEWEPKPKGGAHNPRKLPERTIAEARLYELGPVTWPAYAQASASLRSLTDEFRLKDITEDPDHLRNLVNYIDPDAPSVGAAAEPHPEPERREAVAPPTTPKKEPTTVDISKYVTREEMSARRRELDAEITRMAELPGVLSAPEQEEWDGRTEERDALDAAIAAWDRRLEYLAKIDKPENTVPYSPPNLIARKTETDIYDIDALYRIGQPEKREQAFRDNAMRAVETARFDGVDEQASRDKLSNLIDYVDTPDKKLATRVLLTGAPIYRRVFAKYLAGTPMTAEEQRYAALTVQTDATGGYSVPFYFDPTLVHVGAHTAMNPYRRACRVIPIVGTDTYHGVTAAAVLAARAGEAAAVAEGGGAIGQISAIVGKVHAFVTLSIELTQDRPDISSELASLIMEAKDTEEENIFTNGVGDALGAGYNPIGMLPVTTTAGAYTEVETATNNTFAIADLYTIEAALPIRHRMNAAWFMGRATIRAAQAMETTGGQLFGGQNYASVGYPQNDPFGNTGLRLLNYPVWEVPSAVTGVGNSAIVAAIADPSSFYIIERVGMAVEVVPHVFEHAAGSRPMGQRGVYAWWRNTAKPCNVDAGRRLRINPA